MVEGDERSCKKETFPFLPFPSPSFPLSLVLPSFGVTRSEGEDVEEKEREEREEERNLCECRQEAGAEVQGSGMNWRRKE